MLAHHARHVRRRGLLPAAQDHRPQDEDEQVEAGRPGGDLQGPQEAGGVLRRGVDAGVEGEETRPHGLEGRRVSRVPRELLAEVGEAHDPEDPHHDGQNRGHDEGLAQRRGIAPGREAAPEDDEVAEEEGRDQRVVDVEGPPEVGEQGDREGKDGDPPGEGLPPPEVTRDLEEGDAGQEHEGAAALRDLEGQPLLEIPHHRRLARPDGRQQVQHAEEADHERHERVQVAPLQLAPAHGAPHVPDPEERGHAGHEQERDRLLVALHAFEEGPERPPGVEADGSHRQRPEDAGQEIEEREPHHPHAEGAARRGDGDAQAVGEPAPEEEEAALAADDGDELLIAGVLAESVLQPLPAAETGELEVDLVGEGVGGHRHGDHHGETEEAALGEHRRPEQHRLTLERDAEEQEGVAVLEQQGLHRAAPGRARPRAAGPGRPDTTPVPRQRPSTTSSRSAWR